LYGPPVFDSEEAAFQAIPARLHRHVVLASPFVHVLTHRDLHLHPLRLKVPAASEWGEGRWCLADEWPQLGLPAPLRRLLSE
jgi:A/G-specific adenine glycosylase